MLWYFQVEIFQLFVHITFLRTKSRNPIHSSYIRKNCALDRLIEKTFMAQDNPVAFIIILESGLWPETADQGIDVQDSDQISTWSL